MKFLKVLLITLFSFSVCFCFLFYKVYNHDPLSVTRENRLKQRIEIPFLGDYFKISPTSSRSSIIYTRSRRTSSRSSRKVIFVITGYYSPVPGQKSYCNGSFEKEIEMNGEGVVTASGKKPKVGYVAADTNVLPFGTKLFIPGYGYAEVADIGGMIKKNRIDLYCGKGEKGLIEALQWNYKKVEVTIISMPPTTN